MADLHDTLETLSGHLNNLESVLKPILDKPLNETTEGASFIEKAKFDVTLVYTVHDLLWIYLKLNAIEPTTHPVMAELARIKTYFGKIKTAEGGSSANKPESSQVQIDKAAADRFISAAIGKHTRFEQDEQDSKDDSSSSSESEPQLQQQEVKKAPQASAKKRPKQDPFAGYENTEKKKKKRRKSKSGGKPN